jgi:hypothetical protein
MATQRVAHGDMIVVRYADDVVLGFELKEEAERFLRELRERLAKFGLELHPEKTRLIEFGRYAAPNRESRGQGKPETFDFLGFTHMCGKNRKTGYFVVQRKTVKKRMRAKLQALKEELRKRMHEPIAKTGEWLQTVLRGCFQYYAVPNNTASLSTFRERLSGLWRKVIRRRSQQKRPHWNKLDRIFDRWLPRPRVLHPYPHARFDPERSFGAWARRIATNFSWDHLKAAKKDQEPHKTSAAYAKQRIGTGPLAWDAETSGSWNAQPGGPMVRLGSAGSTGDLYSRVFQFDPNIALSPVKGGIMKTHRYLRAYMAGTVVPTIIMACIMACLFVVFFIAPYLFKSPIPVERFIIFPMALVPAFFGLWNMLYTRLSAGRYLPLGLHGALLPLILIPLGMIGAVALEFMSFGSDGIVWFNSVTIPYVIVVPWIAIVMSIYYLIWKYFVSFFNKIIETT